jgi:hypothetical protein
LSSNLTLSWQSCRLTSRQVVASVLSFPGPFPKSKSRECRDAYPLFNYCTAKFSGTDNPTELIMPGRPSLYLDERIKQPLTLPFGAEIL